MFFQGLDLESLQIFSTLAFIFLNQTFTLLLILPNFKDNLNILNHFHNHSFIGQYFDFIQYLIIPHQNHHQIKQSYFENNL